MNTEAGTPEFWSRAATSWVDDEERVELIGGALGRLAMDRLDLRAGQSVLDIGCGAGRTTFELAQRVAPGGSVLGVDRSSTMLAAARRRAAVPGVDFLQGDAQRTAVPARSVQRVFSRFGVMFFDDPVAAFTNLAAALEPGGRLALATWQPLTHNGWMAWPALTASQALGTAITPPDTGSPGPFALGSREVLHAVLGAAGFSDVDAVAHDDEIHLPVGAAAPFALGSMSHGGIRAALDEAGPGAETAVQQAIVQELLSRQEEGVIRLSRGAWITTATV